VLYLALVVLEAVEDRLVDELAGELVVAVAAVCVVAEAVDEIGLFSFLLLRGEHVPEAGVEVFVVVEFELENLDGGIVVEDLLVVSEVLAEEAALVLQVSDCVISESGLKVTN